jgi:hypothetical protein
MCKQEHLGIRQEAAQPFVEPLRIESHAQSHVYGALDWCCIRFAQFQVSALREPTLALDTMQAAQDMLTPAVEIDIPFVPKSGASSVRSVAQSLPADTWQPPSSPVHWHQFSSAVHYTNRKDFMLMFLVLPQLRSSFCGAMSRSQACSSARAQRFRCSSSSRRCRLQPSSAMSSLWL